MTPNNNTSILPFYDNVIYQNHRKNYAQGESYSLISLENKILPFQIIREHSEVWTPQVLLYKGRNLDQGYVDITNFMLSSGLFNNNHGSIDVIQYIGGFSLPTPMEPGEYIIRVYDGITPYFSEVFTAVDYVSGCLKIEYRSRDNIYWDSGVVDYNNAFKHVLYLRTELGKPEYVFEEDAEVRDGYKFVKKQVSEKTFKFNFLAPEYLLDAMRIIWMSDDITITNNGQVYSAVEFLYTPNWEDGGFVASVDAEFQSDTVIKKNGVGYQGALGHYDSSFDQSFKIS